MMYACELFLAVPCEVAACLCHFISALRLLSACLHYFSGENKWAIELLKTLNTHKRSSFNRSF